MVKTLPYCPPRRCPGLKVIISFLLLIIPLPHSFSYKNLSLCTTPWGALLVGGWDAAPGFRCAWQTARKADTSCCACVSCSVLLKGPEHVFFFLFLKDFIYLFLEQGGGREKGGGSIDMTEKHRRERDSLIGCLAILPRPGTEPATPPYTLARN